MPPFVLTTLAFPCPSCSERCEQDVDCDGKPVGSPVMGGCVTTACQEAYFRGEHDAALDAAWEEFQEAEFDRVNERRAEGGSDGDANLLHIQREARKVR